MLNSIAIHFNVKPIFCCVFLFSVIGMQAQNPADKDTSLHIGTGTNQSVTVLGVLPNNNIFIAGDMSQYNGQAFSGMAVLQPNGTPDSTFSANAALSSNAAVRGGCIEPNGNILIGGFFTTVNGLTRKNLARLKPNGTVDSNFTVGTGANNEVTAIASNGQKIAISGFFSQYNGNARSGFAYLNSDGTLDTSFTNPTWSSSIYNQVVLPNGKVLVGGNFSSFHNAPTNRIARLNTDGSVDTSFHPGSGASSLVKTIVVQPDNKILVGGAFTIFNGQPYNGIVRLNPNGSIDTTFQSYFGLYPNVAELLVSPKGNILVGGTFNIPNYEFLKMLQPNGMIDTTASFGTGTNGTIQCLALQTDGKMLVGGDFTTYQGSSSKHLLRLMGDTTISSVTPVLPVFSQPFYSATCFGDTVVLQITGGNINPTDHWEWRINNCQTTLIDTGLTVKFAPQNDTTTFAVKSSGGATCATVQLIVADTVPPQLSSPLPILSNYCEVIIHAQDAPVATDFCVGQVTGIPQGPLTYNTVGSYSLQWLFDDGHGNTTIENQQIEVLAIDTTIIKALGIYVVAHTSSTAKYQWAECIGNQLVPLLGDTLQDFTPPYDGQFTVIITEGNCTDTSGCKIMATSNVGEYSKNDYLKIYPNPATDEILVHCDKSLGLGELHILSLSGRVLFSEEIIIGTDHKINLKNFAKGVYLIQIQANNLTMTQRLVKL